MRNKEKTKSAQDGRRLGFLSQIRNILNLKTPAYILEILLQNLVTPSIPFSRTAKIQNAGNNLF